MSGTFSISSQTRERAACAGYLLGTAIPLLALGLLIERHMLAPDAGSQSIARFAALSGAASLLSLGSLLMLFRNVQRRLERLAGDRTRLECLLSASRSMNATQTEDDAAGSVARAALRLTGASAAYFLLRRKSRERCSLAASAGVDAAALFPALEEPLFELSEIAMSGNAPASIGAEQWGGSAGAGVHSALIVPVSGSQGPQGALCVVHAKPGAVPTASELDLLASLADLASVALATAELRHAHRNFFSHVTAILLDAIDEHLGYNAGHGERVARLANLVARSLGFANDRLERLHAAALLHDIGMLKIDRHIQHDRRVCAAHPRLGARMLRGIVIWSDVADFVLHHHEWFDGSGYPQGLSGEAIPLESRIIAVCEVFDSMTSASSYKSPRPLREALRELRRGRGSQFDPGVVNVFLDLAARGEVSVS